MKKKLLAGALTIGLLASSTPAMAGRYYQDYYYGSIMDYAEIYWDNGVESNTIFQPITIHVDGAYLNTDTNATIINSRTLVPMRAAGEAVGAEVNWDQATATATAVKDGKTVSFTLNNPTYTIDGKQQTTDTAPILITNRTMLPLRVFAEAFDAEVTWDQANYDVSIDTAAADAPAPNISVSASPSAQKFIKKYYVQSDPSDPYVGSWRRVYSFPNYDDGNNYESYMFISKTADTYNIIAMHTGNPDGVDIEKASATIDTNGDFVEHFTNEFLYYNGPYLGPINNHLLDAYRYYIVSDNTLSQTGYLENGQYTVVDPTNMRFYKF